MALTPHLSGSPLLDAFARIVSENPSLLIEGLWDAPKAALIGLLAQAFKRPLLVISSSAHDSLYTDIAAFTTAPPLEFPSWETLPKEEIAPSPDLVGKRFDTLFQLKNRDSCPIVLAPLQACLQQLPSPKNFFSQCLHIRIDKESSFDTLPLLLKQLGYRQVPVVTDKGEFAVRGGLIDLFPISAFDPYRIDFFGDLVEKIRTFDPISQKTTGTAEEILLFPASEKKDPHPSLLLDYFPSPPIVIVNDLIALEDRDIFLKTQFPLSLKEFLYACKDLSIIYFAEQPIEEISERKGRAFYSGASPLQPVSFDMFNTPIKAQKWNHPFLPISIPEISQASSLHLIAATEADRRLLDARIAQEEIRLPKNTEFHLAHLSSGFALQDGGIIFLPTTEWSHRQPPRRQKWRNTHHAPAADFHELTPGDLVVHFHHGIAKYLGVEKQTNHAGQIGEFLILEYSESSKLFVPIAHSHLVSRYIGAHEEIPTLSTLGSSRWQKVRQQTQQAIIGYADQLLRMNAAREIQGGFACPEDSEEMHLFEEDFPFVATEDQCLAISQIKQDMQSAKAMDRLVCGDVGYGKTEVAMRAAFKAVVDGKKQVALLVPTTVLAMQHYETLLDRMARFPIQIGVLSRFRSAKEIKETLKKAKEGQIDILVGTHRILSQDVQFKDLGLIIVDEEQRFGVRAKEHLKARKVGVDCLTLSATPIPRTLYLSLIGAREISIINTPPQDRLPIKSILAQKHPELIHQALLRELSRDGQAFFIHNRVESIFNVRDELQKLLPSARIVVGHGQMSSDELDTVFHQFKSGYADILVATTIVENGIDIPNANTILIDRADTFGLADLYQMRGRVGRWNRPAYAYFLVPENRALPELSQKRLQALIESSGYGGGMKMAMRDLEIRGAGDILGTQQSGHVASIGFHLYCKLLRKAILALQKKTAPSLVETKMEFSYPASLPDSYINAASLRMEIYHRWGEASTLAEIDALLEELKDRFGPYPTPVLWLYHLTRIRLFASQNHFLHIKFEKITFTAERQVGTTTVKKTFPLPRTNDPAILEQRVIESLKAGL